MPSFRMHLRARGKVAQVFKTLNDAPQHPVGLTAYTSVLPVWTVVHVELTVSVGAQTSVWSSWTLLTVVSVKLFMFFILTPEQTN